MRKLMLCLPLLIIPVNTFAETKCTRYETVEIETCTNDKASKALGGAVLGGLGGYLLGGKKSTLLGALGGGAIGAYSGYKTCKRRLEKQCVETETINTLTNGVSNAYDGRDAVLKQ